MKLKLAIALAGLMLLARPAAAYEFGAYRGAGCDGRAAMPSFESFAGRRVERTVDALSQESWAALESSIEWIAGCWKGDPVRLTLSVPMMPKVDGGTLRDGAAGGHDEVFRHVARALVANGRPDATVRIGWEFNGDWMPWAAAKDPDAYIAYFRRIVAVMRGIPGANFQFDWCPNHRRHAIDPSRAYPGDDVVDLIGMDVYDEVWTPLHANPEARWAWYVEQPYGLRWHQTFAAEHGKPIAYDEWGTGLRPDGHGAGDDPVFIAGMADWFADNRPLYESYWDSSAPEFNTQISSNQFPQATAMFLTRFGASQ